MADAVVLLTPLLMLGALLLLAFAGCSFEPGAVSAPALYIQVRVPTTLTVTEIVYRAVNPNGVGDTETVADPAPGSTEGSDKPLLPSRRRPGGRGVDGGMPGDGE